MAKTPRALFLIGTLAVAQAAYAAPAVKSSAPLRVSVTVVRSCDVDHQSGKVNVRCTRGAADRVMVASDEPRVVTLERQGHQLGTVVDAGAASAGERFLTLQF